MFRRDDAYTTENVVPAKPIDASGTDVAPKSKRGESNYVPVDEIRK